MTCYKAGEFMAKKAGFNTASGMRSHVTLLWMIMKMLPMSFNTASGMRSHVTITNLLYSV